MDATTLSFNEINEKINSDIQTYGWSIIASEYRGMVYANTLGLEANFDHPEIEILGLCEELATLFLNQLAEWVKAGLRLESGRTITEFVEGYEFILLNDFSDPQGQPANSERLRLIWQDSNHCYPWDADCEEECAMQTLIPKTIPVSPKVPVAVPA